MSTIEDVFTGAISGYVGSGGNIFGAILGGLGGLGGSESSAAEDAAAQQVAASEAAIAEQRRAEEQLRADLSPFSQFGGSALSPLSSALGIGGGGNAAAAPNDESSAHAATIVQIRELASQPAERGITGVMQNAFRQNKIQELQQTLPGSLATADLSGMSDIQIDQLAAQEIGIAPFGTVTPLQEAPFQSRAETMLGSSTTNPLLEQASQMRQDGSNILQNPLLQALQDDVTKRVMANQAARGRLGSGSTITAAQNALIPQALAFREQEIGGLTGLGTTLEGLRQQEIGNLFQATGIGANAAARTGLASMTTAGNIGNLGVFGGQAQALGTLGAAQSGQNTLGQVIGGLGGMNNSAPFNSIGNIFRGGGLQQQGPFQATGSFN